MAVPERAFHHLNIRKRIYQKHEKYPSTNKIKRFIDKFIYVSVVIIPLLNVPQLLKILINKNALGVSFISWAGFSLFSLTWVVYGIIHKEKPIIYMNSALVVLQILIAISVLIYS